MVILDVPELGEMSVDTDNETDDVAAVQNVNRSTPFYVARYFWLVDWLNPRSEGGYVLRDVRKSRHMTIHLSVIDYNRRLILHTVTIPGNVTRRDRYDINHTTHRAIRTTTSI